ncbi:FHA domain-containing protein [Stigmatella aurantiaca]|uniref:FHA domain-containing protein n=1 Tax=Stigmatella aurantiaca TaxID=41 RepID=A0A1H7HUK8_STIAU|nr:FHA domain-containing protein [Stigmatella aurantiaca]SEK52750.1 FHA domain-containing protein [Stigmatella aurantiaca]
MSVRLTVTQRSEAGSAAKPTELVIDEAVITLGRDKACQVVLAQQAVSRNHARISQEGNLHFLEDLGSAYGTQINGKPLPKGEKHRLRNGDIIGIAQYDVRFSHVAAMSLNVGTDKTSFVARSLVKDVMRGLTSGEGPYFRIMNGPREGERIELNDAQEIIIGRDETADVTFAEDLVSRRHAKLRRDWSGTHVEDLGSRNGIKVNKKKINRKTLKDGDELEVGSTRLIYVDPTDLPEPSVVIPHEPVDDGVDEEEEEHTPNQPLPRAPPPKRPPKAEPPPEPPPPEPPPPEPEPEPVKAEEPPAPPPEPPRPIVREPPPEPVAAGGFTKQKLVPLVVMGVFALLAIGLIVALIAGA